ncbi:importin subunit alpha-3-like [Daktulosphaira vitifoliae]|uniref:importin subunit alpha-3-like n=1 Tax=Daktulosphaira vitifoliae TaxID=58002 RepID=UPI0021AA710D|nr:importin subunit alpha-3-like [Daktulosphaira vitifoliae]
MKLKKMVRYTRSKKDKKIRKRIVVSDVVYPFNGLRDISESVKLQLTLRCCYKEISSRVPERKLKAVQLIRKLLSVGREPPIDEVVNSGVLPHVVRCLEYRSSYTLQFEAAWVLTNICGGSSLQTQTVVSAGAVPLFLNLLLVGNYKVCEQVVWAIGNIIGDGSILRDYLIGLNFLPKLIHFIDRRVPPPFMRHISWTLLNMCRQTEPPLDLSVIDELIPAFSILLHNADSRVIIDVLWGVSYLVDCGHEHIDRFLDSGLVSKFVSFLADSEPEVRAAAMRVVGNIGTGTNEQAQTLIDGGALTVLPDVMSSAKTCKEAIWFLSNVMAGTPQQIQAVIDSDLLPTIITCLQIRTYDTRKEAVWCVLHLTINGTVEQKLAAIQAGAVEPLCELLTCDDGELVHMVLVGLLNVIMTVMPEKEELCSEIENCKGLATIKKLRNNSNPEISRLANEIMKNVFIN